MTSLLLGLALSAPAHPPAYQVPVYAPPRFNPPPAAPSYYPPNGNPGPVPPAYYPPNRNPGPFPPSYPAPVPAAVTLAEFARCFVPTPGHHEAWVIHPKTCVPVRVCFNLPDCGPPTRVKAYARSFEVRYRHHDVNVYFRHNGTVEVKYD